MSSTLIPLPVLVCGLLAAYLSSGNECSTPVNCSRKNFTGSGTTNNKHFELTWVSELILATPMACLTLEQRNIVIWLLAYYLDNG